MKQAILSILPGDYIWNVCGLAKITTIHAQGISEVDGMAYCCFYTEFGHDSKMSGSIRENRAIYKDGYLCDTSILQFIPNHKSSDFIN
jgi:hypothetical protein